MVNRCSILLCVTCLAALVTFAQEKPATQAVPAVQPSPNAVIAAAEVPNNRPDRQDYRIGAEDLLDISVFDVPEMSRTVRVSAMGTINLPLLGQIQAAKLTATELEGKITTELSKSYIKDPQVSVFVREFKSDPISIVGAVQMPGTYQITSPKRLLEVLALAHGFIEGRAGRDIIITRKQAPPATDAAGPQPVAVTRIPVASVINTSDEASNPWIYPGDSIRVMPAENIYVAGDVQRPGSFPLTGFDKISTFRALALAGGLVKTARASKAVIIRTDEKGNRIEQPVNLAEVMRGKAPDPALGANDILFVPGSASKTATLRAIDAAIQVSTGILIYGSARF